MAVEVVSLHDKVYEVEVKVLEWLAAGALQVWVVNPKQRTVTVHSQDRVLVLRESDTLSGGELLPGFMLALSQVFR